MLDLITAAIVAAISTGANAGLTEVGKTALTDAYHQLKTQLVNKFGQESDVMQAVTHVEAKPTSAARQAALAEEIAAVNADQDHELLQIAQAMLQTIQSSSEHAASSQTATGNYIAQADRASNASVHIGTPLAPQPPSSTNTRKA